MAGLIVGLCTYLAAFTISIICKLELPGCHPAVATFTKELLVFAAGTFLPSLAEDVLTRGYLFVIWPRSYPRSVFVIFSALVYLLNHIYALSSGSLLIIYLFITGVSLAIPIVITRSIWYTLGLHWACNIIYRMSNDIFQCSPVPHCQLSSLAILCLIVVLFIPVNIRIARLINKSTP